MTVKEGQILWEASEKVKKEAIITNFMNVLEKKKNVKLETYQDLWKWSVDNIEDYWEFVWKYFNVKHSQGYEKIMESNSMIDTKWFIGSRVNYAENIFKNKENKENVIHSKSEIRNLSTMNWEELTEQVASVSTYLRKIGVKSGDCVAAYLPNITEAVVAFLATASIGAIWSVCPPEFGVSSTLSRFKQIEPKIFITVDGYQYNGKKHDKMNDAKKIVEEIESVEEVIIVPYLNEIPDDSNFENKSNWDDILNEKGTLNFEQVPFDHPLWILYSSGTTGLPKAIVHGHGGILLTNLSGQVIQSDIKSGDRYFWYTTTGWMLWNTVVGALNGGAEIILYDGSPSYPDNSVLWKLAEETKMTHFGTSPSFIQSCQKDELKPNQVANLKNLESFAYTGAPLSPEGFQWIYDNVDSNIRLIASAGGTDICGSIVSSSPLLPVYAGEIPCRSLGLSVYSYDDNGRSVNDEVGEMVITKPIPSMPLFFWGDKNKERYKDSYYNKYFDTWRHGDLLKITSRGTAVIYGRSDATINRGGVRSGSSEIYRAVETIPEVLDSLVIDLSGYKRKSTLLLFVKVKKDIILSNQLKDAINHTIKTDVSPRHIPNEILMVDSIPMTITGKKMEIPIREILLGKPVSEVVSTDSMRDPESIDFFKKLAKNLNLTVT